MAGSFSFCLLYRVAYSYFGKKNMITLPLDAKIGEGSYVGHPYFITINPKEVIGKNLYIHKDVTIGQENRGQRKDAPVIENFVWIGVNSTIAGECEHWQ